MYSRREPEEITNDRFGNDWSVFTNTPNDIYFSGSINNQSMMQLVKELKTAETTLLTKFKKVAIPVYEDDIAIADIKLKPITLTINSHGGTVYDVFFAIDIIRRMKVDVHTVVSGYCASAGTLLSLSGKKKFITSHSNMLIHEIRAGYWGKKTSITDEYENLNKLSEQLIEYYKKNTKLTEEQLRDILKRDCNWNATECLENGLVDEII